MLLDSNVLIIAATRSHEEHLTIRTFLRSKAGLSISALSRVEVLGWHAATPADLAVRTALLESHVEHPVTQDILDRAADLRRQRRGLKTADAIIAATALHHGLPLVTRNVRDFDRLGGLTVVDPATGG